MALRGVKKFDWESMFADYAKDSKADRSNTLTLKAWCDERNLNYSNTSKHFAELYRLQTGDKLAMLAPEAATKLGSLLQSKDENIAHKTSTAILDRAGYSPQSAVINIQQNAIAQAQSTLNIQPFFADQKDQDDFKLLVGGE
jgi:hypothetical protein